MKWNRRHWLRTVIFVPLARMLPRPAAGPEVRCPYQIYRRIGDSLEEHNCRIREIMLSFPEIQVREPGGSPIDFNENQI